VESTGSLQGIQKGSQEETLQQLFNEQHSFYTIIKRLFDIIFSSILLIILSPVFVFTAIMIKLDSPGSIFYKSIRIGSNCKYFYMIKFRSMCQDADEKLKHLSKKQLEEYNKNIKLKDDIRITRVGKIIRRASIDELPQLINVIKGDMSLVGPRPPLLIEEDLFGDRLKKIMAVRPRITGPWQVNGRNDIEFNKRIILNEDYVDHYGIKKDIEILLKTVSVVLSGKGAA